MLPSRLSHLIVLLSAGIFLLAPLAPLGEASSHDLAHMGAWAVGDHWNWRKDPTTAAGSVSTGNLTWQVAARENVTLDMWEPTDRPEWRTQDVWRVQSWQNKTLPTAETTIEIRQENTMYRRAADQAIVRSEVIDRFTIKVPDAEPETGETTRHVERFAPLLELQFPFGVDDAWRVRTDERSVRLNADDCGGAGQPSCRGGGPFAFTYSVAGTERLTLTLKGEEVTMDTWRIKVTDEKNGRYEIWWYAEEACNVVLREQFDNARQKIGIFTLTDYQCSGETAPDPDYALWEFDEFSSTRFHGALSKEALRGLRQEQGNANLFSPGPAMPVVVLALCALALFAARREARI